MSAAEDIMDTPLLSERRGPVLWLTLNRPSAHNALNGALTAALLSAVQAASGDQTLRAIVLTGAGDRTFCSGADLKENNGGMFASATGSNPIADLLRAMQACGTLVIGRLNGSALAGGLGLVAACDLVYAADHAKFGLPEVRVGVFPLMIMANLIRQVPRRRFYEMAYLGQALSAHEAERYDIINRAVPAAELDALIDDVLSTLMTNSPAAISAGKKAIMEMQDMTAPETLAHAETMIAMLGAGADALEGRAAFAEKRKPKWAVGLEAFRRSGDDRES
jgi:enoyl-CoA hydratase/carnithine racemase